MDSFSTFLYKDVAISIFFLFNSKVFYNLLYSVFSLEAVAAGKF